jgi:hypothetical protein
MIDIYVLGAGSFPVVGIYSNPRTHLVLSATNGQMHASTLMSHDQAIDSSWRPFLVLIACTALHHYLMNGEFSASVRNFGPSLVNRRYVSCKAHPLLHLSYLIVDSAAKATRKFINLLHITARCLPTVGVLNVNLGGPGCCLREFNIALNRRDQGKRGRITALANLANLFVATTSDVDVPEHTLIRILWNVGAIFPPRSPTCQSLWP